MTWRAIGIASVARCVMFAVLLSLPASVEAQQRASESTTAVGTLAAARALRSSGNASGALDRIERFLAGPGRNAALSDQAVLRLEAARIASAEWQPDRARRHVELAGELAGGPAFRLHPLVGAQLHRELARISEAIGNLASSERFLSLAIPVLASADPSASADAINARGVARLELLRIAEASVDFRTALGSAQRSNAPAQLQATILTNLTMASVELGQLDQAAWAIDQIFRIAGADDYLLRVGDFARAQLLVRRLDIVAAEAALQGVAERAAIDDPLRGHALLALATARFDRGRIAEAQETAREAVEAYRAALGERHPAYGRALHTLGVALGELGDPASAAAALQSALEVNQSAFGGNSLQAQATELELAWLDLRSGDHATASRRADAALRAYATTPPPDTRPVGLALIIQAMAHEAAGRHGQAVILYRRGQGRIAEAKGSSSPDLGFSLIRLGRLLTRMGILAEAGPPIDRAIEIYMMVGGAGTVRLADALTARAELRAARGDRRGGLDDTRRAFELLQERIGVADDVGGSTADSQRRGTRELYAVQARLLVSLADDRDEGMREAFIATQASVTSRSGDALRRATLRRLASRADLSQLVADRERALDEFQQSGALILASAARGAITSPREVERLRAARDDAAIRLRSANAQISRLQPRLGELLHPRSHDLSAVQRVLAEGEALVVSIVTDDGVFVWTLRRARADVAYLPITASEVARLVRRLRNVVDLGLNPTRTTLPRFDLATARTLFDTFFGAADAQGLFEGVDLITIVPDGAMQSLPPHLLVDGNNQWFVRRFATAIAPSIGVMVTAREQRERPTQGRYAFLGIGDPTTRAFAAAITDAVRGPPGSLGALRSSLSRLPALPETANEIHRLAEILGPERSRLLLGGEATKRSLFAADLAAYRVISFATHALMAGELYGLAEPSIVLTPANDGTPFDGLLTASDVSSMNLDADLVLLSACNTAAPDGGPYAEGMSGLARAFLQAGARTLLVTHWAVSNNAAVALTTRFVEFMQAETGRPRAYALRRSILEMIDGQDQDLQHPAFWSPFVLIGN